MKKLGIGILVFGIILGTYMVLMPKNTSNTSEIKSTNIGTEKLSTDKSTLNEVTISNFAYSPAKITIKKGQSVRWTNKDVIKHDITPDNQTGDFAASQLLAKNESFTTRFNTIGSYSYHCSPHSYMKAIVEVTE